MSRLSDVTEQFLSTIAAPGSPWRSADVRVLAVHVRGEWQNVVTRCWLDPRPSRRVPRLAHLPATPALICRQFIAPANRVAGWLDAAARGRIDWPGLAIHYTQRDRTGERTSQPYDWANTQNGIMLVERPPERRTFIGHRLWTGGEHVSELIREVPGDRPGIDHALRTLRRPWDGLESVARHILGVEWTYETAINALLEVVAPLHVSPRFEECTLESGVLRYVVRAATPALAHTTSVGVFALDGTGRPLQTSSRPSRAAWSLQSDGDLELRGTFQLPGAASATLILRTAGFAVANLPLRDTEARYGNLRVAAYATIDADLAWLRECLRGSGGGKDPEKAFERAVTRLLTLGGFQADGFAWERRLSEAVDGLAYVPGTASIYALECTTGSLNASGKLGKFVGRLRTLAAALADAQVHGVVVTALPRAATTRPDREYAGRERLTVLCCEDLEELLALVQTGAGPHDVAQFLDALVPDDGTTDRRTPSLALATPPLR